MTETFDPDWLALREPLDAMARNVDLAFAFDAALPARPRLLDLGAGSGSLFRWLAPQIGRSQVWIFADADAALLGHALDETEGWAWSRGWTVTTPGRAMLIHTDTGTWRIETSRIDLAGPLDRLPMAAVDGVLCSALLDLVSADWVRRFASVLRLPLLACLSVDGRDRFLPADPHDSLVLNGFRRDQGRDKGFGPALGPRAPSVLMAALKANGFAVRSATSDWRIDPNDPMMLDELIVSHTDVARHRRPDRRAAIEAWQMRRLDQIDRCRLRIRIGHRDILALPPAL